MINLMESGEVLLLSYGMGLYRITSTSDIDTENEYFKHLGIYEIFKTGEGTWVGIAYIGHAPSKLELAIHQTEEFLEDQKQVMQRGPQSIKDRFYDLYKSTNP
jgi:hypothetical protein